jgi:hypothetical protein
LIVGALGGATNHAISILGGDIDTESSPTVWDLTDGTPAALSFDAPGKTGILLIDTSNGAEGISTSCYAKAAAGFAAWGVTPPGSQPVKIADPTGQANDLDSEARTAINAILDVLEGAGLSAAT